MRKLILAGVAAMALGAASAHADPILVNGDFENAFTGWTNSGGVTIANDATYTGSSSFSGTTGTGYFATFGSGNAAAGGLLSQSIVTDVGQIYNLSFSYGALGTDSALQSIFATAGGLAQTVTSGTPGTDLSGALVNYTFSFIAGAGSSTLITFTDTSAGPATNNVDGLLDNVSIPEPTSMLVLGTSLIALGGARRRRTNG